MISTTATCSMHWRD